MDKAYQDYKWHDRPNETTPVSETNLDAISHGLSIVDDRVIELYNTVQNSVSDIRIDEKTGEITYIKNNGSTYQSNLATKIYNTMKINQQAVEAQFAQISGSFDSVENMLAEMDSKIDLNAEFANAGIENLQTTITENDGYYRSEMTGISHHIDQVEESANISAAETRNYVTNVASSITQTTQAIQLSVSSVTRAVGDVSDNLNRQVTRLDSRINVTAGDISLKVSKLEVLDDLQQEFDSSAIQLTPDRITFASTGALVVNTKNFKLDALGNATFGGTVKGASIEGSSIFSCDGDNELGDPEGNAISISNGKLTSYYHGFSSSEVGTLSLDRKGISLWDGLDTQMDFTVKSINCQNSSGSWFFANWNDFKVNVNTVEIRGYLGVDIYGPFRVNDGTVLTTTSDIPASQLSGNLNVSVIPNLPASKITSGTIDAARLPSIPATKLTGTIDVARLPSIPASKISGSIPVPTTIKAQVIQNTSGNDRIRINYSSSYDIHLNGSVNIGNGSGSNIRIKGQDVKWQTLTVGGTSYKFLVVA